MVHACHPISFSSTIQTKPISHFCQSDNQKIVIYRISRCAMHFCEEKGKLLHVYKEKSSPGSLGQLAFAAAESQSHAALPAADSNKSITVSSVGEWRCGMWSVQNILPLSLLHPQVPLLLQHQVPSMGCSPSQNEIPTVQNSPSPCPFNGVQTVQTSGMSFFKLAGMASFLTRGSF